MPLSAAQIASDEQAQSQYPALSAYPGLLAAIENQESGGNLGASNSGSTASGPFQFVQATGQQYGLTYGATGTVYEQAASAQAAAHYLSDLVTADNGNVNQAVSSYSGGNYNYNQLAQSQGSYLTGTQTGVDDFGNPVYTNPAATISAATAGSVGSAQTPILQGWANYLGELAKRVGVGGLGLGLIFVALFWLFAGAAIHEWKAAGKPVVI